LSKTLFVTRYASTNLRLTNFKPFVHEVILDPRDAAESPLDETHLWDDEDFEEEEEEVDEVEQEIERKVEEAAEKARHVARWEAKKEIEARERARKRYEEEEKATLWVQQHPEYMLVRRDGRLVTELRSKEEAPKREVAVQPQAPKPAATDSAAQVRAKITHMIRKELPALTEVYNGALQKEADKPPMKKPPQKETISTEAKKNAT